MEPTTRVVFAACAGATAVVSVKIIPTATAAARTFFFVPICVNDIYIPPEFGYLG
ncbi:unannotated protein [freshwater metagenome]|uniref:Unannotated protein n=1 Tax=freshwater metagenome TaxID=449393 RepID=A0A6J6YRN2_9ZZZZ